LNDEEPALRLFQNILLYAALVTLSSHPGFAQKLVDPDKVAPEYREAAQKRRAEQIKQQTCSHKADVEKILPRDRTAYIQHCLDEN
jgi:hypothetical protein